MIACSFDYPAPCDRYALPLNWCAVCIHFGGQRNWMKDKVAFGIVSITRHHKPPIDPARRPYVNFKRIYSATYIKKAGRILGSSRLSGNLCFSPAEAGSKSPEIGVFKCSELQHFRSQWDRTQCSWELIRLPPDRYQSARERGRVSSCFDDVYCHGIPTAGDYVCVSKLPDDPQDTRIKLMQKGWRYYAERTARASSPLRPWPIS